jgi:hypothetical protein
MILGAERAGTRRERFGEGASTMSQPPVPSEPGGEPASAELSGEADPQVGTAYALNVR